MPLSQLPGLNLAAHLFAAIGVGFGVNALIRPENALSFFEFNLPAAGSEHALLVNSLLAVYGIRDIFMGLAIFFAAIWGTKKSLGWTLIASSGVAYGDGLVCYYALGHGQWNHWGYAPMMTAVGLVTSGLFDGSS